MPRDMRPSTMASTCRVLRPRRSSFHTVRVSSPRRWSRDASSWGRFAVEPLTPWSVNTRDAPAPLSASSFVYHPEDGAGRPFFVPGAFDQPPAGLGLGLQRLPRVGP
jgi:hypothetical protein